MNAKKLLINVSNDFLHIDFGGSQTHIRIKIIMYLKAENREVVISTGVDEYRIRANIDELLEVLAGEHFVRVHPDYAINLAKVGGYHGTCFYMSRESSSVKRHIIEIGENYLESMLKTWDDYLSRRVILFRFAEP